LLGLVLSFALAVASAGLASGPRPARADCAFPFTPVTYEDLKDRKLFLDTIDLASFNLLFPGNPDFGLPELGLGPRQARAKEPGKVPPSVMKAIGWIESSITQAAGDVPFGAIGPALISFDCGHGVAQVTTGMTAPAGEAGRGSPQQALIATHFAYNIARGAFILADKWNQAPKERPIAGTDTNGHPALVENWYFAIWSYNGFTGPGANRSNHPMDPIYGQWPRPQYSCGATGDGKGHNRGAYPYQELVFGCMANPPIVEGRQLWAPAQASLPDLSNPAWREPLSLSNFVFPYTKMDIPSPQPFHLDTTPSPDPSLRAKILGQPRLALSESAVKVGLSPGSGATSQVVQVRNVGTGVLAWYAIASEPWIVLRPYAGAAVGPDLRCQPNVPCDRDDRLEISVDATKAPPGSRTAFVEVRSLSTNDVIRIRVDVSIVIRIGAPGVVRN
jgi:hypothetical protein